MSGLLHKPIGRHWYSYLPQGVMIVHSLLLKGVNSCYPTFALATPLEYSSIGNLALRLAWSRSIILPVLSVTLVLTIVMGVATAASVDISATCIAMIAMSTATVATTIVAVVHIGMNLALVGTFSCPVSRFATSVAVSRLGAGWLHAHLGLKQGTDVSASAMA